MHEGNLPRAEWELCKGGERVESLMDTRVKSKGASVAESARFDVADLKQSWRDIQELAPLGRQAGKRPAHLHNEEATERVPLPARAKGAGRRAGGFRSHLAASGVVRAPAPPFIGVLRARVNIFAHNQSKAVSGVDRGRKLLNNAPD